MEEKQVAAPKGAPAEKAQSKGVQRKTTLAELGPNLPIGIETNGTLSKAMAWRPWRTREERELGKLKKPRMTMGQYVGMVIATMYTTVGTHNWLNPADPKLDTKRVLLNQMYMADVFYMYIWLRIQSISNELKMDVSCLDCGHKFKYTGDLNTVEVVTVDSVSAMDWEYTLRNPFQIAGKEAKKLLLRAPRWGSLDQREGDILDSSAGKTIAVSSSIIGMNDDPSPVIVSEDQIDEMSKYDLENICEQLNDNFVGPKMAIEGECTKCSSEFKRPINWSYDSFFSLSSR